MTFFFCLFTTRVVFFFQETYEELIGSVLNIFKPGKFLMTLMVNEVIGIRLMVPPKISVMVAWKNAQFTTLVYQLLFKRNAIACTLIAIVVARRHSKVFF